MSDLLALGLRELGRRLRAGETTPRALAEDALARLDRDGRRLNAVAALTADRAAAEADRAGRELRAGIDRGPLHGIPYGAKDLLAAVGAPTTWGAAPLRDQQFAVDAVVVGRLREAGAVLVGKLATVELAGGFGYEQPDAAWTGPGRNPWDPACWTCGSSSGSGAAVAAGLVPFALGSETWGSITCPAAYCGVAGFRPTYGLVPRTGAMALSWTMDKLGPLALRAEDCERILAAIAGPDASDPSTLHRPPFAPEPLPARPRVGVLRDATIGAEPEVAAAFQRSLDLLAEFADVVEVDVPDLPYGAAANTIIHAESAAAFEAFVEAGLAAGLTAPEDRIGMVERFSIPAVDYLRALRVRRVAGRVVDAALAGLDAVAAPTQRTVATGIAARFDEVGDADAGPGLGAVGNLCGLPAVSLPNGFGRGGLPTAVELMGRADADATLLAIAAELQRRSDWHLARPPGWGTAAQSSGG